MQVNSQKNGSEKIINWASEHFRPWKKRKISTDNTGSIHGGGYHKAEQLKSIKKKKTPYYRRKTNFLHSNWNWILRTAGITDMYVTTGRLYLQSLTSSTRSNNTLSTVFIREKALWSHRKYKNCRENDPCQFSKLD